MAHVNHARPRFSKTNMQEHCNRIKGTGETARLKILTNCWRVGLDFLFELVSLSVDENPSIGVHTDNHDVEPDAPMFFENLYMLYLVLESPYIFLKFLNLDQQPPKPFAKSTP